MNLLLDTHVLLWIMGDSPELSDKARNHIRNSENALYWSAASFWELTVKVSLGKLKFPENWMEEIREEKTINRILDLPILEEHCKYHLDLPWHHRDPFDRILICQAMAEDLTIVTRDANIRKYNVKTAW